MRRGIYYRLIDTRHAGKRDATKNMVESTVISIT